MSEWAAAAAAVVYGMRSEHSAHRKTHDDAAVRLLIERLYTCSSRTYASTRLLVLTADVDADGGVYTRYVGRH